MHSEGGCNKTLDKGRYDNKGVVSSTDNELMTLEYDHAKSK